jgi:hypothetical protein
MTTLDPQIAAELEELEAAFAADVRAVADPMPPALKARLQERIDAGFPSERKRAERHLPRWALPAMGFAATALIAVVVVGSNRDSASTSPSQVLSAPASREASDSATSSAGSEVAPLQSQGTAAGATAKQAAPLTAAAAPAPQADTLQRARKVERAVDLALRVGAGQLEEASDGVVRTTQRLGGYVADSQVSARGNGGSASFTVRVPASRLDTAIAQLAKLGHVARLDQSSHDITSAFVSVEDRLSDARAERRALLRALAKATTSQQIASLRARIRINRSEIAQYKGQLDALRRRANLATIDVAISARGKASAGVPGDDDTWSPGDAAKDALRVLEVAAGVLLIAFAVTIPLALLTGLAFVGGRGLRRRRREHALDAA